MPFSDKEGIHLRDYIRILGKRRLTVVTFFVTTFLLVMLGTFLATPEYKATTEVIIEKSTSDPLTGRKTTDYDPHFYETQFELIQSQVVARRVVDILSLEETYDAYLGKYEEPSLFKVTTRWLGDQADLLLSTLLPQKESEEAQGAGGGSSGAVKGERLSKADRIALKLRRDLEVEPIPDSRFVAISFISPNREFSALAANAFAKAYLEETLNMKMEATRRTLAWMTKKAEDERAKLEASEQKIQEFMRDNNLVTLENRVAVLPQQLSQVGTELVRAQTSRKAAEALYEKVKRIGNNMAAAETIPAIASDPALRTLQSQILKAEQNIMELSGKYGNKHPVMIKARGDLEVLKRKKRQEIQRIIESIRNEYELARSAEDSLSAQMRSNKSEAQQVNEKFIQYQALNRELETNRQLYDALMVKIKEETITGENQPVVKFWIVEKATVPNNPVSPRTIVNAFLGIAVGLFGGIGLAFFAEYLDNTVKDPEEAENILGLATLGTIATYKEKKPIEEVVLLDSRSAQAESYKALRTAIMLSSAGGPPATVLVTSSLSGEGKTTTAVNLALALAQSGKKVLLIDADLRKPRLHKVFKLRNKNGLSTYLAGRHSGENIIARGPLSNLAVIPSGPIPPNPSELLSSDGMKSLLETLDDRFDTIICDSPPVLSVTDPRVLSRLFDGTVLVAKGGQTTYDVVRRALKSLRSINAPLLGLVINNLDLRKSDYYYNEYYSAYEEEQKTALMSERLERMVGEKES